MIGDIDASIIISHESQTNSLSVGNGQRLRRVVLLAGGLKAIVASCTTLQHKPRNAASSIAFAPLYRPVYWS